MSRLQSRAVTPQSLQRFGLKPHWIALTPFRKLDDALSDYYGCRVLVVGQCERVKNAVIVERS